MSAIRATQITLEVTELKLGQALKWDHTCFLSLKACALARNSPTLSTAKPVYNTMNINIHYIATYTLLYDGRITEIVTGMCVLSSLNDKTNLDKKAKPTYACYIFFLGVNDHDQLKLVKRSLCHIFGYTLSCILWAKYFSVCAYHVKYKNSEKSTACLWTLEF